MGYTDKKQRKSVPVTIQTKHRHKSFEDLAGQVVGDMRDRMEKLREETGRTVTQAMLAQALELDPSAISKTINGDPNLTLRKISDFAAATGSKCYFRMTRDPHSEIHTANGWEDGTSLKMMTALPAAKRGKMQNKLSLNDMLQAARKYIEEILESDELLYRGNNDQLSVKLLEGSNWSFPPFDDQNKKENGISVRLRKVDLTDEVILFIAAEFTFADGYSEVEWVLYDISGHDHFRSRDLQQVARLAAIVMSRGGFKV